MASSCSSLSSLHSRSRDENRSVTDEVLGIGLALAAATGWAGSALFARLGLQHVSTKTGSFVSALSSLLLLGLIAIPLYADEMLALPMKALLWLLLLGVFNYVLGRFFKYRAVRLAGVARAAPIYSSSTLFAVLMAIMFLGETPSLMTMLGTLAIISGVILVATEGVTQA